MLLSALAALACADDQPRHTFELVDENGIPTAVNSGVPKYEGELFDYEKVVELREDPDCPESFLYQPRSFTLGDDARYYVADNRNDRVAVFDSDGVYVDSIGRSGDGPGELRGPETVDVRDGVVTVRTRKITRFRTDGTFIEDLTPTTGRLARSVFRASDGTRIVRDAPQGPEDDGYYYASVRNRVLDADDNVTATIETARVPVAKMTGQGRDRAQLNYAGMPFSQLLDTNEIVAMNGVDPVIMWYGLDGRQRRQVRIDLPVEPVTAADKQVVADRFDRLIETGEKAGGGDELTSTLMAEKADAAYPDEKGFSVWLFAEQTGWLWLRVPVPQIGIYVSGSPDITQQQRLRVVDPEGRYVGVTHWPPEVNETGVVVRGRLLAMVVDPTTEETILTVYRIRSRIPGLVYP